MNIAIIGDSQSAKATRALLRQAGFAVQDAAARSDLRIWIEERAKSAPICFDSIDAPLEAAVVRHVSQLSCHPIVIDRPGGSVRSDCELRIDVPEDDFEQQRAVQLGILRGLLDFTRTGKHKLGRWRKLFGASALLVLVVTLGAPLHGSQEPQKERPAAAQSASAQELPASWRIKIRDLQFEQDKLLLKLKDLQLQESQTRTEIAALHDQIQDAAYQAAQEKRIDVRNFVLDLDTLTWLPKNSLVDTER